jgi:S-DNA-T family DNA segregation ATPase FtsK/SpoIIIE
MERRYDLIEMAGVRDLEAYNNVTRDDPEKEFLPKLVVVIDELADLMMTAPDSVETSICRIAQKGREAGIHLVIGTQRPSVDVITGLIKANVPSRIAFTVSSQIDSRTIIDVAGAEKLIGRGDMLYSPIGSLKPTRLQGAFVSDGEVERITAFIRDNNPPVVYDDSFVRGVETEAERCTIKSKSKSSSSSSGSSAIDDAAADSGENALSDPKFNEAVNVAIEAGKISTSYLQRRMSIGYGRAAKLIDAMEKLGIVSQPDGQRARNVLISQSEWSEMMMHQSDDE